MEAESAADCKIPFKSVSHLQRWRRLWGFSLFLLSVLQSAHFGSLLPAVNKIHMLTQLSSGGGSGTTSSSDSHGGKVKCHLRNVSGGLHHREVKKITDSGESSPKSVLGCCFFWGDSCRVILMTLQKRVSLDLRTHDDSKERHSRSDSSGLHMWVRESAWERLRKSTTGLVNKHHGVRPVAPAEFQIQPVSTDFVQVFLLSAQTSRRYFIVVPGRPWTCLW